VYWFSWKPILEACPLLSLSIYIYIYIYIYRKCYKEFNVIIWMCLEELHNCLVGEVVFYSFIAASVLLEFLLTYAQEVRTWYTPSIFIWGYHWNFVHDCISFSIYGWIHINLTPDHCKSPWVLDVVYICNFLLAISLQLRAERKEFIQLVFFGHIVLFPPLWQPSIWALLWPHSLNDKALVSSPPSTFCFCNFDKLVWLEFTL
jgi:hypothetical protein